MEWSDKFGAMLKSATVVMKPYQHPYRSKERGDVCNQIALSLSGLDHPKFKVNKRSMRDRTTLLITKNKAKIHQEEDATKITREETELDQALKKIIDRRSWPTKKKKKRKREKLERDTGKALWNVYYRP